MDHLRGTREPGNFPLRPSVCFSFITTTTDAQGVPSMWLYSAEEESPASLFFHFLTVFAYTWGLPPLKQTLLGFLFRPLRCGLLGNYVLHTQQPLVSRCSAAVFCPTGDLEQAAQHSASMSRNHSVLSWSSGCVGALTAETSSVLTAAASGLKHWHLLTPFLHSPVLLPVLYPH